MRDMRLQVLETARLTVYSAREDGISPEDVDKKGVSVNEKSRVNKLSQAVQYNHTWPGTRKPQQ